MDVCDEYEHPDPDLEYIIESSPYELFNKGERSKQYDELKENLNSVFGNPCGCTTTNCSLKETCHHGGNYEILKNYNNETTELVINKSRQGADLIYECYQLCNCSAKCHNRLIQFGPRKNLKIIATEQKGRGLMTTAPIPEGGFICEYAGEILTKHEAEKRTIENTRENKMNYIMCLNESLEPHKESGKASHVLQTFIDPSRKGNIGRYINHSCDPNCEIFSVRVDNPIPKIGIFAKRNINQLEELSFHYGPSGISVSVDKKPCFCGAAICHQFLPSINF